MAERSFIDSDGNRRIVIDGDTILSPEGNRQRIEGLDALETDKIITNEEGELEFIRGDYGGSEQADAITKVIKEGNFNIVNETDRIDNSKGARELVSGLSNPEGKDLVDTLYASGILKIDENASSRAIQLKREADLIADVFGEEAVPYSKISKDLNSFIDSGGLGYKTLAVNEAEYDPEIHSGVQFRAPGRTLDNKPYGLFGGVSPGLSLGYEGLKEGLFGYADAIGQSVGFQGLESFGEAGVARSRERISQLPELVLDYKDVDSVRKGFEYMINNMAVMAPQMLTAFGSMALAVPVGAAAGPAAATTMALSPIALVSAGQAWNEMTGEKGAPQLVAASLSGVGVAALERFGLSKLISPGKILTQEGSEKVIKAIQKKAADLGENISEAEARRRFNDVTKKEIESLMKSVGVRLEPDMIRRFSIKELLKRAAQGTLIEGGTELLQETLQMATVQSASGLVITDEEAVDRMINALLAGGVVGGPLSAAGSLHSQGKNSLLRSSREVNDIERFSLIEQKKVKDEADNTRAATQKPRDVEDILSETDEPISNFDPNTDANKVKATAAHNKYKKEKVGIGKMFTGASEAYDYVTALGRGLRSLINANEKEAISMERLVESDVALADFHTWAAETTGRYHTGSNFKEFQDLLEGELSEYIDDETIANLFNVKGIKVSNAKEISKQIIDFASTIDKDSGLSLFELYDLDMLGQSGAYVAAKQYADNNYPSNQRTPEEDRLFKSAAYTLKTRFDLDSHSKIVDYLAKVKKANAEDSGFIELKNEKGEAASEEDKARLRNLYYAAAQFRNAQEANYKLVKSIHEKETGDYSSDSLDYDPNAWYKDVGFDWQKVKSNKEKFMKWLEKSTTLTSTERTSLYESIVRDGQGQVLSNNSLVQGAVFIPNTYSGKMRGYSSAEGFDEFSSGNLFQASTRNRKEAAKYASVTKYFGHGGRKLNATVKLLENEGILSNEEIERYMYHKISTINSVHGNFNRIENKKWAAAQAFLTSWSLMAGLPMAAISSIPETPMVYFNVKDDVEFNAATRQLTNQISQAFTKAIDSEVKKTEQMLKRINQSADAGSVVDRFATGERDIAFLRLNEAFFRGTGIVKITQVQRRIAAGMAIDFVRNSLDILDLAPRKIKKEKIQPQLQGKNIGKARIIETDLGLDFDKMSDYEMRAYNQLVDLGIDVNRMQEMLKDLEYAYRNPVFDITVDRNRAKDILQTDYLKSPSDREYAIRQIAKKDKDVIAGDQSVIDRAGELQTEVNDMMDLAVYRFVKERVQLPGAANRPLWMQDPHYQLFTQFNGFISTFTANIIPKLWNNQIRKGNPQVKYDTFALIVTMIALGGASQYLKDLLKFGQPSPYLDNAGYMQRALYSSGVLGQYERVVDIINPLYAQRTDNGVDWLFSHIVGEAGPTVRNIGKVMDATGNLIQGQTERAIPKYLGVTPGVGPFTGLRYGISDVFHGENPIPDVEMPTENNIRDFILK